MGFHNFHAEDKRKKKLVIFEKRAAHIGVKGEGEMLDQRFYSLFDKFAFFRIINCSDQKLNEPVKRILVHCF